MISSAETVRSKRIVNVYRGYYGYCDFVRGTAFLMRRTESVVDVTWSVMMPLRDLLEYPGDRYEGDDEVDLSNERYAIEETQSRLTDLLEHSTYLAVRTNQYQDGVIYPEELRKLFVLKKKYAEPFEAVFRELTDGREYHVIHCRLGDSYFLSGIGRRELFGKYRDEIRNLLNTRTILVTDDAEFRDFIRKTFREIVATDRRPVQTGICRDTDALLDTFYELLLITRAKEIVSLNSLPWGTSGFSLVPSQVFGIPIRRISIH